MPKISQNSNGVTPNGSTKCRWGRLNGGAVAANWRLSMQSVVNLARLQVYHTERPSYLFAARSPWCTASRGFVSDGQSVLYCTLPAVVVSKNIFSKARTIVNHFTHEDKQHQSFCCYVHGNWKHNWAIDERRLMPLPRFVDFGVMIQVSRPT